MKAAFVLICLAAVVLATPPMVRITNLLPESLKFVDIQMRWGCFADPEMPQVILPGSSIWAQLDCQYGREFSSETFITYAYGNDRFIMNIDKSDVFNITSPQGVSLKVFSGIHETLGPTLHFILSKEATLSAAAPTSEANGALTLTLRNELPTEMRLTRKSFDKISSNDPGSIIARSGSVRYRMTSTEHPATATLSYGTGVDVFGFTASVELVDDQTFSVESVNFEKVRSSISRESSGVTVAIKGY
ncbi:hypothetical protein RCL1_006831 [Eukaryota sp. TZLM3-RCL]